MRTGFWVEGCKERIGDLKEEGLIVGRCGFSGDGIGRNLILLIPTTPFSLFSIAPSIPSATEYIPHFKYESYRILNAVNRAYQ